MTDIEPALQAHSRVVDAVSALLRRIRSEAPIPHLTWTVGELGAHLLGSVRDYERAACEDCDVWTDLRDGDAENARQIQRTQERDTSTIAARLESAVVSLHDVWRCADGPVRWSGGLRLPVDVVLGIHLADMLVHGWDLARAARTSWRIDRADAVLALHAVARVAPHFVAPAAERFSGVYEVRLRGNHRLIFAFEKGTLRTDDVGIEHIDCRLSADPATFLLTSYGRVRVWRAATTGKIRAAGRKPWLALRFKSLLVSP